VVKRVVFVSYYCGVILTVA